MTILLILPHYRQLQHFSGVYLNLRQFTNIQLSGIWLIIAFDFIHKAPLCLKFALGIKTEKLRRYKTENTLCFLEEYYSD